MLDIPECQAYSLSMPAMNTATAAASSTDLHNLRVFAVARRRSNTPTFVMRRLVDLGWVEQRADSWRITSVGRAAMAQ